MTGSVHLLAQHTSSATIQIGKKVTTIGLIAGLALLTVGALALSGHIPSIGYGGGVTMMATGISVTTLGCLAGFLFWTPMAGVLLL